jgi:hypothetical protein
MLAGRLNVHFRPYPGHIHGQANAGMCYGHCDRILYRVLIICRPFQILILVRQAQAPPGLSRTTNERRSC